LSHEAGAPKLRDQEHVLVALVDAEVVDGKQESAPVGFRVETANNDCVLGRSLDIYKILI